MRCKLKSRSWHEVSALQWQQSYSISLAIEQTYLILSFDLPPQTPQARRRRSAGELARVRGCGVLPLAQHRHERWALSREHWMWVGRDCEYVPWVPPHTYHSWIRNLGRPTAALFFDPEPPLLPLFFSSIILPIPIPSHNPLPKQTSCQR